MKQIIQINVLNLIKITNVIYLIVHPVCRKARVSLTSEPKI